MANSIDEHPPAAYCTSMSDQQASDGQAPEPETNGPEEKHYQSVFVARQPIFDVHKRSVGHELLYRDRLDSSGADFTDNTLATLKVVSNAFVISPDKQPDLRTFINFSEKSIHENVPYALPAETTVVEIDEPSSPSDAYMEALAKLKEDGYSLALDGFEDRCVGGPLMDLADYIKIDVLAHKPDTVAKLAALVRGTGPALLAKRVEGDTQFSMAKALGFKYFQGFFFKKPVVVPGRRLSSNETTRLRLFRMIEREIPDFGELAETIQADVSISYRLLTLLNSAAFSFPQKIRSIKQALVILGGRQLKNWLRLVILTDMMPTSKTAELLVLSTQRGKFFELAADTGKDSDLDPNALFLLGLFSLLEAMLDMPMPALMDHLPLDKVLKDALCGEGNEAALWLQMTHCFEHADWECLASVIDQLGLDPITVAAAYHDSLDWTATYFEQGL